MPVLQHLPELPLSILSPCTAAPTMLRPGLARLLLGPTVLPSSRAQGLGEAGSTTPHPGHRWALLGTAAPAAHSAPVPGAAATSSGTHGRKAFLGRTGATRGGLAVQAPCNPCSPLHPASAGCMWQETHSICWEVLGSMAPERPASCPPTPTRAESI